VYVKKGHFDLENLQYGDQVEISLVGEFDEVAPQEGNGSDNADNYTSGQIVTTMTTGEDELAGTLLRLKGPAPTTENEPTICNIGGEGAETVMSFETTQNSDFGDDDSEPDQKPNI